jgi:23S rRNA (guanine2445-N2)-methyltransferase / 23S rRNA (guanine2069-N7)-methyltransferase
MVEPMPSFFATCPRQLELLLATELQSFGAREVTPAVAGVSFSGDLEVAYRALVWSRLANHIYQVLNQRTLAEEDWEAYYQALLGIPWTDYFTPDKTFAIDVDVIKSSLNHRQYGVQRAKDAVVDTFRARFGERPSVAVNRPDVAFHILIKENSLVISFNLSGESLHRRGYRLSQGEAPLKENLAAAVLLRAGWPACAREGKPLVDPMCGSGTLLIEAALMAGSIAPGLFRDYFAAKGTHTFDALLWQKIWDEAEAERSKYQEAIPPMWGFDADGEVLEHARANILRAGLSARISLARQDISACKAPTTEKPGMIIVNPPYGERLGELSVLPALYQRLGEVAKAEFPGWRLSVLTGNPEVARALKLAPTKIYKFFNGTILCELWNCSVHERRSPLDEAPRILDADATEASVLPSSSTHLSPGAEMVKNRLVKNLKHLQKWAKRAQVSCFRLYDADLPEYAAAVDFFEGKYLHVQEYAPPKTIPEERARLRLGELLLALEHATGVNARQIFVKTRKRQSGKSQYQAEAHEKRMTTVNEGPGKFLVNFKDYLDCGLFLDSRLIRQLIFERASGKTFLNLFCYTGSASVYAGLAGARKIVSVDLSHTYLGWARENFALNNLASTGFEFVQADCLAWLEEERRSFDLILLDPPTFSNSKRMRETLDIERDHPRIIALAMKRLTPTGTLIFVTNKSKFVLAEEVATTFKVEKITRRSVPEDFKRHGEPHQAFLISRGG